MLRNYWPGLEIITRNFECLVIFCYLDLEVVQAANFSAYFHQYLSKKIKKETVGDSLFLR